MGTPDVAGRRGGRRGRPWLVAGVLAAVMLLVPLLAHVFARTGQPAAVPGPSPAAHGLIPMSVLRDATIHVPAWPADAVVTGASGWLRFTDGRYQPAEGAPVRILESAYGDVDRDGAPETVVSVHAGDFPGCDDAGSRQMLALDRDASGTIVTLGRVAATTGQVKRIGDFSVTETGNVRVRVADALACRDETIPRWQTRWYAWHGAGFVQVAGPSRFPPGPRAHEG